MPLIVLPATLTHALSAGFVQGLPQAVSRACSSVQKTSALSQERDGDTVIADASGLSEFDSSALAVLLECRRQALALGKKFAVLQMPARLQQLASLYGVQPLLPALQ